MYLYKIFFYWWWCFRTRLENRANDFNFSWNGAAFLSKTLYSLPTTSFCWGCRWWDFWIFEFQVVVFPAGWWVSSVTPSVCFTMRGGDAQQAHSDTQDLTLHCTREFLKFGKGFTHAQKKEGVSLPRKTEYHFTLDLYLFQIWGHKDKSHLQF